MKTGKHLKIVNFGTNVLGVELLGKAEYPEPDTFLVKTPVGIVEISRCTDGSYWFHVTTRKHPETGEKNLTKFVDARIDRENEHTSQVNIGDFGKPDVYHIAIKAKDNR